MFKSLKKVVAIIVTLAFALSLLPNFVLAEVEDGGSAIVPFTNYAYSRTDGTDSTDPKNHSYKYKNDVFGGNNKYYDQIYSGSTHHAYAQFNLAGYEEILQNESTKVSVKVAGGFYGGSALFDFSLIIAPDSVDSYSYETITYNTANKMGFHNVSGRPVLFVDSDGTYPTYVGSVTGEADKDALVTGLNEGTDNSFVSLYFLPKDSTKAATITPAVEGTGLIIDYVESDVDNQAYVNDLANKLVWEDMFEVSSDGLVADLVLPSKWYGAGVTWKSSDTSLITDDGKITPAAGDKEVTLTATLSYKGLSDEVKTATKDFKVIVASKPAKTVIVPFKNPAYSRSSASSPANPRDYHWTISNNILFTGGSYAGYAQIDFSGYEAIINAPNTTIGFNLWAGSESLKDLQAVIQPGTTDDLYDANTITYNIAESYGMHILGDKLSLFIENDGQNVANGEYLSGVANIDALRNALNDDVDNSIITLYFKSLGSGNNTIRMSNNTGITISYYEDEINEDKYADDIYDEFEWNRISNEDVNSVTDATKLPLKYKGLNVQWSSTEGSVVNTVTGAIVPAKEEKTSELTATLTYKDNVMGTKSFEITVLKEEKVVKSIDRSLDTYIDDLDSDYAYGAASNRYRYSMLETKGMYKTHNDREDRHAFMKWDLSNYVKEIEAAEKISIRFVTDEAQTHRNGFNITVMSKDMDNWTNTLTYDSAVSSGMYTDSGIYTEYGANIISTATDNYIHTPITSEGLTNAIKAAVANDPENAVLSLKYSSADIELVQYQLDACYLDIEYYESDVKSDDEYVSDALSVMPWSAVSTQDINNVVANLALPGKINGETIAWTSDNQSVISNDGTVIIPDSTKVVNLTATAGETQKVFTVTVPANGVAAKSNVMSNVTGHLYNYSNGYVYANSDVADPVDVAIATYKDGELINVTVKENVTLKKGINVFYSDIHQHIGVTTKAIVVDEINGTIKPLAIVK